VDLNNDGRFEKLTGATCGNGGCEYYCFKNLDNQKYKFIDAIFIHHNGFEVLKTRHRDFYDILNYCHSNASEGIVSRYEFDGFGYKTKESVKVESDFFNLLRPTAGNDRHGTQTNQ
jgi:hypothetical protein